MHTEDTKLSGIEIESNWIDKLHQQFTSFYVEIESAKQKILNLPNNWDEEGAKRYKEETLDRVVDFIRKLSYLLWKETQKLIHVPNISPVPDGSIDIHWKNDNYDLLVNIPEDNSEPATFSSDDYKINAVKGTFDQKEINPILFYWLTEYL